jgi:hypothetical protein
MSLQTATRPVPTCRRALGALALAAALTPLPLAAGDIELPVDAVSIFHLATQPRVLPEQIPMPSRVGARPRPASNSAILQAGTGNRAYSGAMASPGAVLGTFQTGEANTAQAAILESPGSAIAQTQIGDGNISVVGIIGGRENTIATGQIGNALGVAIGLVDSIRTQITYGQTGQGYSGGIVILNAPAGTVITLN